MKERERNLVDVNVIKENAIKKHSDSYEKNLQFIFSSRLNKEIYEHIDNISKFLEEVNISSGTLSNYRTGKRMPDCIPLRRIADELNVSSDYLLGKSKNKNYNNHSIGKFLGLNDKTIEVLNRYQQNDFTNNLIEVKEVTNTQSAFAKQIQILNSLISSGIPFMSLLIKIETYLEDKKKLDELPEYSINSLYSDKEKYIERKVLEDKITLDKYNLQEELFKVIDYISPNYYKESKEITEVKQLLGDEIE